VSQFSHSAGGIVINSRGDVLVVKQRDGSWSLPKGKLNPDEKPQDAAMREIIEESGLRDLNFVKLLKSYSRYGVKNTGMEDKDRLRRLTFYLFTTNETELRPMDPRIHEARWVPQQDVTQLLTHPKDQDFFTDALPEVRSALQLELA
jgi:ADP-ribose pyrophosphatase YjhB (NUDIX family)